MVAFVLDRDPQLRVAEIGVEHAVVEPAVDGRVDDRLPEAGVDQPEAQPGLLRRVDRLAHEGECLLDSASVGDARKRRNLLSQPVAGDVRSTGMLSDRGIAGGHELIEAEQRCQSGDDARNGDQRHAQELDPFGRQRHRSAYDEAGPIDAKVARRRSHMDVFVRDTARQRKAVQARRGQVVRGQVGVEHADARHAHPRAEPLVIRPVGCRHVGQ